MASPSSLFCLEDHQGACSDVSQAPETAPLALSPLFHAHSPAARPTSTIKKRTTNDHLSISPWTPCSASPSALATVFNDQSNRVPRRWRYSLSIERRPEALPACPCRDRALQRRREPRCLVSRNPASCACVTIQIQCQKARALVAPTSSSSPSSPYPLDRSRTSSYRFVPCHRCQREDWRIASRRLRGRVLRRRAGAELRCRLPARPIDEVVAVIR